jgi:sugar lactone lactonase YvrE
LNPSAIEGIAVDKDGNVFTANMWEEQGQDFRKVRAQDGSHVFNAKYSIRGSNPDAMPYAIAVDDRYIYCSTSSHTDNSAQHVRRFNIADGTPAPFPAQQENGGHIFFFKSPEKHIPEGASDKDKDILILPLRALAVTGGKLYVGDSIHSRVHIFDKESGAPAGTFAIPRPHAMTVDPSGKLWIASDAEKIIRRDNDGSLSEVIGNVGYARALAIGPHGKLFVADRKKAQISIFDVAPDGKSAKFARTFGHPAKLGEGGPDNFYKLTGVAVDPQGNVVISQGFPITGSRLTRFSPDGTVLWDQIGAEFCSTGNYSQDRPDELISHYFNRYLLDKQSGSWKFNGFVLDGDSRYPWQQHGVMRIQEINGEHFLFQSYGDGLQVYRRRDDGTFRLASMFGIKNPMPDGTHWDYIPGDHGEKLTQYPFGLWAWSDLNGDGKVDENEVNWFKKPGENFGLLHFGVNVDKHGNGLICDHHHSSVFEMPLAGFDAKGNPRYDYSLMKQVIPPDPAEKGSRLMSQPLMAVRAADGSIYVHGRSDLHPVPSGHSWTCGWIIARYDQDGKMLWWRKLPEACPGMDAIPGENAGVMLASFVWKEHGCDIFHYTADGLLIGVTRPAPEFLGYGGIPDNVASLAVSRDPRDGILDVFVEDCIGNRFHWHRIDDRQPPQVMTGTLNVKPAASP